MTAARILIAWFALLPLAAFAQGSMQLPATVESDGGTFRLALEPSINPVPFNELFELQVDVSLLRKLDDTNPLWLDLQATMPGHGHGMNTHPRIDGPQGSRFIVRGLLLHMSGEWEFTFDVAKGRTHEKAKVRFALGAFDERERKVILSLSPLPSPPRDTTNRADGNPKAIALGKLLFSDPRLSGNGRFSCASCHDPANNWTDGKEVAVAVGAGPRNTPSLWNTAHNRWYFWDGRPDSLWSQALKPIERSIELDSSRLQIVHLIRRDAKLHTLYEQVFGKLPDLSNAERFPAAGGPQSDDGERQANWWAMDAGDREIVTRVFANVGKAIAAFEGTIISGPAPFDRFIADVRAGKASTAISPAAQRGLKTFIGEGNCVLCHSGPAFTNKEFHDIRVPYRAPDAGRAQGLVSLSEDEFVSAGPYSDDPQGSRAQHVLYLDGEGGFRGHFKTPSLRNVALTAPYMHAGQYKTLRDVVHHYSTLADAVSPAEPLHIELLIRPFPLDEQQADDLVAFLESLTGEAPKE